MTRRFSPLWLRRTFPVAAVFVVGCGGGDAPTEEQADQTAREALGALVADDASALCDSVTDDLKQKFEKRAGSCESGAERFADRKGLTEDLVLEDPEVGLGGNEATATARGSGVELTVQLEADGDEWRIADLVATNRARVTQVVDGDTVALEGVGRTRLIGVDTPEEGRCYDNAATAFTRSRLDGQLVRYEVGVEPEDRYGRTLAYVYRGDEMHNLALLEGGYAKVLTIPPNDKFAARFERAERSAESTSTGRFGVCDRPRARPAPQPRPRRPTPDPPAPPPDTDLGGGGGGSSGCAGGPVPAFPGGPRDGDGDGLVCE